MVRKYAFQEDGDIAAHIRDTYGFDGDLARLYVGTTGAVVNKWHHYLPIYERHFSPFRGTALRFLEIGVQGGGSLRLWRDYFGEDAVIFGIDIKENCARFDGQAGRVRIGSQADPEFLRAVVSEMGGLDIVLDDGSHKMAHIRRSLDTLFPLLSENGVYMIEDLHTAYWEKWGGGLDADANFFNRVRGMIDDLHHWYHKGPVRSRATHGHLAGIHIYDSITVFDKATRPRPVHSKVGAETPGPADAD